MLRAWRAQARKMAPKTPGLTRPDPPGPGLRPLDRGRFRAIDAAFRPSMLRRHMATKKKAKTEEVEAEAVDPEDEDELEDDGEEDELLEELPELTWLDVLLL